MNPKLFLVILGCKPNGRNTEQHDVFFGIGNTLSDLLPEMEKFWPKTKLHIDSWREINTVDGYVIKVVNKEDKKSNNDNKLFFLNLGGYKPGDMEEHHYKLIAVAKEKADAINLAKQTAFYKHTGFKGATSHIDDKYGVDIDDIYEIEDILSNVI
ncbi:MAG: DUF1543 domain-containing protein, partial [Ferruginibacter sp.]